MELIENGNRFDELQPWYVGELIASIKTDLVAAGIEDDRLKELCGSIAFSVCCHIDGTTAFKVKGQEYGPILAFMDEADVLFYPGGNSFLHEYVFGVLDEIFESDQ